MMKRTTFAVLWIGVSVAALFFACKNKQTEVEKVALPVLRPSCIYWGDSVYTYIRTYGAEHAITAEFYYKKGERILDEDPKKAIWYVKRAITLHPKPEYYNVLGTLLLKTENYAEGYELYELLCDEQYIKTEEGDRKTMYIFGRPTDEDIYNYALCSILRKGFYFSAYTVDQIRKHGFDPEKVKARLLADKRFPFNPASVEYKNIMLAFFSQKEVEDYCSNPGNFLKLIAHIEDTFGFFTISELNVSKFNYEGYRGEEYGEVSALHILEAGFFKEVREKQNEWLPYNCNHAVALNSQVYVLVYATDTSATACPREMRHVTHTLATYTPEGKIIDTKAVAWQSGNDLGIMSYNYGTITINTYKRIWKKPYHKREFDNEVVTMEDTGQFHFVITADGKITEQQAM